MTTFPVRHMIVERPSSWPALVFHAARPLPGPDVDALGLNIWHAATLPDYRPDDALEAFRRLDAHVVVCTAPSVAIREGRAAIEREYGPDVADDADDDVVLDYWRQSCAIDELEVTA